MSKICELAKECVINIDHEQKKFGISVSLIYLIGDFFSLNVVHRE